MKDTPPILEDLIALTNGVEIAESPTINRFPSSLWSSFTKAKERSPSFTRTCFASSIRLPTIASAFVRIISTSALYSSVASGCSDKVVAPAI